MRKNEAAWVESRKRWQIKVQSEGERKTFTDSTPGKKGKIAAERKADRWLEDHLTGDGLRSDVLLDRFLQKKKKKDTTSEGNYEQVEKYVRLYIRPVIGKKKIGRLTENDLQEVIDRAYSNGLAYKTLCNIRGTISSFMKYCRKDKATTLFPESLVVPAGAKRGEKHIAQPNEVKTLFNSDKTCYYGKEISDRYIHAYRFAVLTGIRPGELLGLQWSDVNGDKLTIRQHGHGGRLRPPEDRRPGPHRGVQLHRRQEDHRRLVPFKPDTCSEIRYPLWYPLCFTDV